MNILLIDYQSCFLDFAIRCEAFGHTVRVFMGPLKNGERSTIGDGILTKVKDWEPSMKWADLVFLSDNTKYLKQLEKYRRQGCCIFGPSADHADWELERSLGQAVLADAGIEILESAEFINYDKAIQYVETTMGRYVSKPSGDADKALSYVSKGPADMIYMLEYWKKHQKIKSPFILQKFAAGIEMAVGGWFGAGGFSPHFLENFEFKKLMNGEVGVNTGEMGTAMKYCSLEESKLAQEILLPLEPILFRSGYTGFIDVSVIISKSTGKPMPMELTCRLGWPLFQIQQVLHPEPVEWMQKLCRGDTKCFEPSHDIALGVVMAIPKFPYPIMTQKELSGYPVWGISDKNRYNVHPAEMMLGEAPCEEGGKIVMKPMLVSSGCYLLVCSGTGKSVSEAKAGAYAVLGDLEVPNSPMYRTDIGDRLEMQLPKLQAQGYATSWKF